MKIRYARAWRPAALAWLAVLALPAAGAGESVGRVMALRPSAVAVRDGGETPLKPKAELFASDLVRTGPAGRVQMVFTDKSLLVVGPGSEMALDRYADGENGDPAMGLALNRGEMMFQTGPALRAKPDGFSVKTPAGTVGIRGSTGFIRIPSPEECADGLCEMWVGAVSGTGLFFRGPDGNTMEIPVGMKAVTRPGLAPELRPMAFGEGGAFNLDDPFFRRARGGGDGVTPPPETSMSPMEPARLVVMKGPDDRQDLGWGYWDEKKKKEIEDAIKDDPNPPVPTPPDPPVPTPPDPPAPTPPVTTGLFTTASVQTALANYTSGLGWLSEGTNFNLLSNAGMMYDFELFPGDPYFDPNPTGPRFPGDAGFDPGPAYSIRAEYTGDAFARYGTIPNDYWHAGTLTATLTLKNYATDYGSIDMDFQFPLLASNENTVGFDLGIRNAFASLRDGTGDTNLRSANPDLIKGSLFVNGTELPGSSVWDIHGKFYGEQADVVVGAFWLDDFTPGSENLGRLDIEFGAERVRTPTPTADLDQWNDRFLNAAGLGETKIVAYWNGAANVSLSDLTPGVTAATELYLINDLDTGGTRTMTLTQNMTFMASGEVKYMARGTDTVPAGLGASYRFDTGLQAYTGETIGIYPNSVSGHMDGTFKGSGLTLVDGTFDLTFKDASSNVMDRFAGDYVLRGGPQIPY